LALAVPGALALDENLWWDPNRVKVLPHSHAWTVLCGPACSVPQESNARGGQIGQFAHGQIFIGRMVIFGHHGGTSRGFPAGV